MPSPRGGVGSERPVDSAPKDVQELAENLESSENSQEQSEESGGDSGEK